MHARGKYTFGAGKSQEGACSVSWGASWADLTTAVDGGIMSTEDKGET